MINAAPLLVSSLLLAGLLVGCGVTGGTSREAGDAALAGRIFQLAPPRELDQRELLDRLARAEFVLLGERHDAPEHHRLQAQVVEALQARWGRPAPVVFEMIGTDRQLAITLHLQAAPGDAAGLAAATAWAEQGWPDWALYQPIALAALDAEAPIVGGGIPRDQVRLIFADGADQVLAPGLRHRSGLDQPFDAALAADLRAELAAAHCGEVPPQVIEGMARVQRARDAVMADRLAVTAGRGHAILIAGTGHVRVDRGVPWYLARLRPAATVASLALVEVGDDPPDDLPFDYVWFTEAIDHPDPCAS